ncbi:CRE-DIN-1 protein [Caenorhabditis remanei]|uniref:CRE-DIN-1 protein n=1 Tax=Caenorhabditis remanei TaxID=31234 RepID=E3LF44_CAERE|nr:CRE-DIN-1 protein [Caenorhabditis remanei]
MVQVPSTNTVKESRHVAVYGLPNTIPDDSLQSHFARFGPVQRLYRQDDQKDVIFISFMDSRSASVACKTDSQYDEDTPYRITYHNPDSLSNRPGMASVPTTPSSAQSSSPRNHELSPQRYVDGDSDAEPTSSCFRSQVEVNGTRPPAPPLPPRIVRDANGTVIEFPSESIVCVIYEVQCGSTSERDVFELVKKHSKGYGVPIGISFMVELEPGVRKVKVHHHKFNEQKLRNDKSLLLGKPLKYKIIYPPEGNGTPAPLKHPICQPSTSNGTGPELKGDALLKANCAVFVPHTDRQAIEYYYRRFNSYGQIIGVDVVASHEGKALALVQFTNVEDAFHALMDPHLPKPMQCVSRISLRIIIFYLPKTMTNEEIMLTIRGFSNKIKDILVNWIERSAILYFDNLDDSIAVMKKLKIPGKNNFGEYKVAVDYCPEKLNNYFKKERLDQIEQAKAAKAKAQNDTLSEPSTSRIQNHVKEILKPKLSVDPREIQDDCMQPSTSNSNSVSSDEEEGSSTARENSDNEDNNDEDDDEDTEFHDDMVPGRSQDSGESQSPGVDEKKPECNGTREHDESSDRYCQPSTSTHQDSPVSRGPEKYRQRRLSSPPFRSGSPHYDNAKQKQEIKEEFSSARASLERSSPNLKIDIDLSNTNLTKMLKRMKWKNDTEIVVFASRIEEIVDLNLKTRAIYEKITGRPFPKFTNEDELRTRKLYFHENREYYYDNHNTELDIRIREWRKLADIVDLEEFRSQDPKELLREIPPSSNRISGRPSLDESRFSRVSLSFDSTHHPAELAQRSHSLCIGPMTPATPYPPTQPLLVNTSQQHSTSQPSASGVTTPRSAQPPMLMSPVSRHNSMSSTGRPASIQTMRHHSVMFPPDVSIPPPPIPPSHDELMAPKDTPPSRRSSETLAPLKSPPFGNQIQNLMSMPIIPPAHMIAATGTHSVSSSAHSTPRHSISGTPVHCEPSNSKSNLPQTPKSSRPEKVHARHDSISKPGPSNAVNALQARSQSMISVDHKKSSTPSTPVVRDAGSDLIAQIMSNQPSMGFKKLPRIEKKPSALQNVHNSQTHSHNTNSTPSTPSTSNQAMLAKDKEREKEKRRKEREMEREREARKEMKRKETKEERHKRKEMERAKREEDERRERKREKQRIKEKEERRKEKEKERRKAEKEKMKKKKHRKEEDSDESGSTSNEELDLDVKKSTKELTQEEKDHQLALILSKGSIYDNLNSRRRSDRKGHDSLDKLRQKNQNASGPTLQRRVLIESSEDDEGDDDEDKKSESSSGEASETEQQRFLAPPSIPSTTASTSETVKEQKHKNHKEREKGELSSSSEDEENHGDEFLRHQKQQEERENRKRQKSLTNYSSDEQAERIKRSRREDNEDVMRQNMQRTMEEQKLRKRKLAQRLSSEDESKRKAKQRDFRDIPHEDVSDEEEIEEASRIRRQSTSSVTSNHGRKEKSGKTPLRVVTPAVTPLQSPKILSPKIISPKILSPKILSPKTSITSTKRSSISDTDPLISPRPRNRTTSSTSTATTSSKPDTSSVTEKLFSPPASAKNSVSSIDDLSIREEFNANSAVASPMSTTGKPMVLTKAAMKAFNSTPPKKQSSSSGPHDSSSASSSSSTSEGSSSSDEESSDDETLKTMEPVAKSDEVAAKSGVSQDDSPLLPPSSSADSPVAPFVTPPEVVAPEKSGEPELAPVVLPAPTVSPVSALELVEEEKAVSPALPILPANEVEEEDQNGSAKETDESVLNVESDGIQEEVQKPAESDPVIEEPRPEADPEPESESFPSPAVKLLASPTQSEVNSTEEPPPPSRTIISDQETDQAVQSIFDEEEADEFPQYPDFVMTNEEKEVTEKELPAPVEKTKSLTSSSSGSTSSEDISPKPSTSSVEPMIDIQEDMEKDENSSFSHKLNLTEQVTNTLDSANEPTPMRIVEDDEEEMRVDKDKEAEKNVVDDDDEDDDYGEKPLEIVESSPERTPTPELIPNEKMVESVEKPVEVAIKENHQDNHQLVQAPVQPTKPLEVIVSQSNSQQQSQHQVIQPSPRPAFTPIPQQSTAQPVSVVQQPQPSPAAGTTQTFDPRIFDELVKNGKLQELAALLESNPQAKQALRPETAMVLQQLFLNAARASGNVPLAAEMTQAHVNYLAEGQELHASANAKMLQELKDNRRVEEESFKRKKEENDRKVEQNRQESVRKGEDKVKMQAMRATQNVQQSERLKMDHAMSLIPPEIRKLYSSYTLSSSREPHGLVNGTSQHHQLPRPSSTASTSSNSARTPLRPSSSINRSSVEPKFSEEATFQRWFYNVSLSFHFSISHFLSSSPDQYLL